MPNKTKKTKKKRRLTTSSKVVFLFNTIEFLLVSSIVILFYLTLTLSSTRVIFIPKGSTNAALTYLNKSGYELNIVDKLYVKTFLGYPQSGWIDIKTNYLTKADFLYKITTSKAALRNITLIPGETSYIFLNQLAKKMKLSRAKLEKIYNKYAYKKDGNILADTYALPYGMKEDHLLFYLFSNTNREYEEISKKIFGTYNKQRWYYYITLASVVQKEAANKEEMKIVSSVIHNRLKKGMKLQMDGTLNYGKYSHVKITAKRIREDNSSYNTYKNTGLPAHPVSAVSLDAIKAAIFPAKTQYLYFVKSEKTKKHLFAKSYKEHLRNIENNRIIKRKLKKKIVTKVEAKPKKTIRKKSNTSQETEPRVFPEKKKKSEQKSIKSLWESVK